MRAGVSPSYYLRWNCSPESVQNGEYEVKRECDESFMTLRALALLLPKANLFLRYGHENKLKSK